MKRRVPLNPREAKACCTCRHWRRRDRTEGECRHPKARWGVTYRNEKTGEEQHVEWWTTGCYATCALYEPDRREATANERE